MWPLYGVLCFRIHWNEVWPICTIYTQSLNKKQISLVCVCFNLLDWFKYVYIGKYLIIYMYMFNYESLILHLVLLSVFLLYDTFLSVIYAGKLFHCKYLFIIFLVLLYVFSPSWSFSWFCILYKLLLVLLLLLLRSMWFWLVVACWFLVILTVFYIKSDAHMHFLRRHLVIGKNGCLG